MRGQLRKCAKRCWHMQETVPTLSPISQSTVSTLSPSALSRTAIAGRQSLTRSTVSMSSCKLDLAVAGTNMQAQYQNKNGLIQLYKIQDRKILWDTYT